jgi:hypothetical protein
MSEERSRYEVGRTVEIKEENLRAVWAHLIIWRDNLIRDNEDDAPARKLLIFLSMLFPGFDFEGKEEPKGPEFQVGDIVELTKFGIKNIPPVGSIGVITKRLTENDIPLVKWIRVVNGPLHAASLVYSCHLKLLYRQHP